MDVCILQRDKKAAEEREKKINFFEFVSHKLIDNQTIKFQKNLLHLKDELRGNLDIRHLEITNLRVKDKLLDVILEYLANSETLKKITIRNVKLRKN